MKTKLLVLIAFILLGANTWGQRSQNKAVQKNKSPQGVNNSSREDNESSLLFKIVTNSAAIDVKKDIKNAVFLEINFDELSRINKIRPSLLTLTIPTSGNSDVSFNLHDAKVLANTFSVVTGKNEKVKYNPGLYYQGTVSGISPSLAGCSMFDNSIMAVFSYDKENWVLGLWNHPSNTLNNIYILYKDSDVQFASEFKCETDQLPSKIGGSGSVNSENLLSTNCIKIYFECDYQMFVDKGGVINVVNYVTGMFNVVQLLFNNESVNTEITEIYVWSATDPYISNTTSSDYLNAFQATRTTFNGNLAHLLTTRTINLGGRAYLDVICSPSSAYGFSNIYTTYNLYPNYSNTILIVTHELGHNFGSQHTHWCGWPGGPIDDCVPVDDGPCTAGPGPINGGTIMSYCHLNGTYPLSNGFGPLPGNQIRSRYAAASCLTACDSPPDADFAGTPLTSCTAPLTVTFTDQTVGATTAWAWDINNDGITDYTTQSPTHNYSATGTYTVKLIVSNANGSDTIVKTNYIIIGSFSPSVSIAISSGSNSICANIPVTFTTTPIYGGPTPAYQWYNNGTAITGAIYPTFTSSLLSNNDVISCQIVSNAPCVSPTTASSNGIIMNVTPHVMPNVTIAASGPTSICNGETASFSVTPVNGGTNPVYQWKVNGNNVGTSSNTYSSSTLSNGDLVSCVLSSSANCANPISDISNIIPILVNPITTPTVSISITTGINPTCPNAQLIFTATSTNGGITPIYQWKKNGSNIATGNTYNAITPANSDIITCVLTSNASCVSITTATSNATTLAVIASQIPTVSIAITYDSNPICSGSLPTFTATVGNSTSPTYQWFMNGASVSGAQNSIYTPSSAANGSMVTCMVNSMGTCPESAVSTGITVNVTPVATVNFISDIDICGGTTPVTVFSSTPLGANFSWVNSNTAIGLGSSGSGNIPSFNAVNNSSSPITSIITVEPSIDECPGTSVSYTITVEPTPTIIQNGNILTSSSASSYQWYRDGQLIPNATNQSYNAILFGYYSVIIDGGLCQSNIIGIGTEGIDDLGDGFAFVIYPNPNDGDFFISFNVPYKDNYSLKIFNSIGQLVFNETLTDFQGEYSHPMKFKTLAKGGYMLKFSGTTGKLIKRIIIY